MTRKKLSALWDRLSFAKQAGRQVDLRATMFACLASEAERETDKLVRRYEQRSTPRPQMQFRGERFRSSQVFRRDLNDRRRGASRDNCFACGEVGHFARDCRKRRDQPLPKKPRTDSLIKLHYLLTSRCIVLVPMTHSVLYYFV